MQGGKGAVGSVLEAAANIAASAKSGLDKTKAVVEEKVERMATKDEVEKDIATLRKEEKLDLAERRKCKAYAQNAAAAAAPHGAVSPNFTDGGGLNTTSNPSAILSSNADLGCHEQVVQHIPVVDSNPNHSGIPAQVVQPIPAVDSNPNHPGMPAQVVQPVQTVDSNPNHPGMPAQVVQPVQAVDSNWNHPGMAGQVVQPVQAVDSNPNHPGMPGQVVHPVQASHPNHPGMPGEMVQPVQAVDSHPNHTGMPAQVVKPVGGGLGSENDTKSGTYIVTD